MNPPIQHWFIGWDEREGDAYRVTEHSLLRHATCEIAVHPIKHREMRRLGLFWREWRMDGSGQWWDHLDGRPFSTEFAFTRFLTPLLAKRLAIEGWVFFVDADFLFLDDVAKLWPELDNGAALACVKHDFRPKQEFKMDGQIQIPYDRKNWSSLMAFDTRHTANDRLTAECVSTAEGSWLHHMDWLTDVQIAPLSPCWNWLVGHSPDHIDPKALHFTDGGPWFDHWRGGPFDDLWRAELARALHPTPTTTLKRQVA